MTQGRSLAVAVLILVLAVAVWIVLGGGRGDDVVGGGAAGGGDAPLAVAEAPAASPPPAASGGGVERTRTEIVPEAGSVVEAERGSRSIRMTGRCVAAESGEPLAGCVVTLSGWRTNSADVVRHGLPEWQDPEPVVTGADGVFVMEFPDVAPWQYALRIRKEGRVDRRGRWSTDLTADTPRDFGDVLLASGVVVRGRVVDGIGQPVMSATVHVNGLPGSDLENPGRTVGAQALSGEDGAFAFDSALPAGNWPVDVRRDGFLYAGDEVLVVPEDRSVVEVLLSMKATPWVAGHVRLADGTPVEHATVEAEDGVDGWMATDRTAEDGSFRIHATNDAREAFPLSVEGIGIEPLRSEERFEWGQEGIVLTVWPALALELTVIEAGSGAPVNDYAVKCHAVDARSSTEKELRLGGERADGRLTVDGIARGENLLTVVPKDPALRIAGPLSFTATDAGVEPMTVEVERMQPLRVRVVRPGGAPVEGARVQAVDTPLEDPRQMVVDERDARTSFFGSSNTRWPNAVASAETAADGIAALHWPATLEEGSLRVEDAGRVSIHEAVRPLQQAQPIEVVIGGIGRVHGTLRHPLVGSGRIGLTCREEPPVSHAFTELELDGAGVFEAEIPTGEYRLFLTQFVTWSDATSSSSGWDTLEPELARFVIEDGVTTELEVDGAALAFGSLRGRVTLDGQPYVGPLSLNHRPPVERPMSWGLHSVVRTDTQGRFVTQDLPPGRYTVALGTPDGGDAFPYLEHPDAVELAAGETAQHDYAFARRTLVLRILAPDTGAPLADTEFRLGTPGEDRRFRTDSAGRLRIEDAPLTPFRLVSFLPSGDRLLVGPISPPTDESESEVEVTATRGE